MAYYPIKMNTVNVIIKQLIRDTEMLDEDWREMKGSYRYEEPITLKAQVNFGDGGAKFEELSYSMTGDQENTSGHLVFSVKYLTDNGITLRKGDVVTSIAGISTELVINQLRYESPLRGGFLLLYVNLYKRNRSS
jgi:hypothetical protein